MKTHYWSCTKLADKIRGTDKPTALGWEEWGTWKQEAKQKHPIRYWIAERGLDYIQDTIWWVPEKISDFRYWWYVRWTRPSHVLRAHKQYIKPGTGHNLGHKMLPCIMSELVDFVEIDKARENMRWDSEKRKEFSAPKLFGWFGNYGWRNPEAGLDYLDWEISLGEENQDQAKAAQEIKLIYLWWKHERPNRPDPYEHSGWTKWCSEHRRNMFSNRTPEEQEQVGQMLDKIQELEVKYDLEDKQMLHRVVDQMGRLW